MGREVFINKVEIIIIQRYYVKNSLIISPKSPNFDICFECTSQMALSRQDFPFIPNVDRKSSTFAYKRALQN